jgi:hypothetical protein
MRDLLHNYPIKVSVSLYRSDEILQDVWAYLFEEEPGLFTAEIKMPLFAEPNDIQCDVQETMTLERIKGQLMKKPVYKVDNQMI